MERLIRYGSISNDPLYDCSNNFLRDLDEKPPEPQPVDGIICSTVGITSEILFVLCIKAMLDPSNFKYPTYKIMIVISICDMCGVMFNSIVFGIMYYYGATFCDSPNIIYIIGCFGASAWIAGSLLSTVLIINRLVEINCTRNKKLVSIFNGHCTPFAMLIPIIAGFYYLIKDQSLLLDPKSGLASWYPWTCTNATCQVHYFSPLLIFNNTIVVSLNSVLSVCLCFNISKRLHKNFGSIVDRRRQASLLFQCLAIVSLCNLGSLFYLINFFFECPLFFQKLTSIIYQMNTNLPPYIYLILNRSIRQKVVRTLSNNISQFCMSHNPKTIATISNRPQQTNASMYPNKRNIQKLSIIQGAWT